MDTNIQSVMKQDGGPSQDAATCRLELDNDVTATAVVEVQSLHMPSPGWELSILRARQP